METAKRGVGAVVCSVLSAEVIGLQPLGKFEAPRHVGVPGELLVDRPTHR